MKVTHNNGEFLEDREYTLIVNAKEANAICNLLLLGISKSKEVLEDPNSSQVAKLSVNTFLERVEPLQEKLEKELMEFFS